MSTSLPAVMPGPRPASMDATRSVADVLHEARGLERAGCVPEATALYERVVEAAVTDDARTVRAEALRRLGKLYHHRGELERARECCVRSGVLAGEIGNAVLHAEAFNALGCMDLTAGSLEHARTNFARALELGGANQELRAHVEQNLGVVANIQGNLDDATRRYESSLAAYRAGGNEHGCAIAYHNLGLVTADRERWDDAETHFSQSLVIAERAGDVYLRAACLLGVAKVNVARQRFEDARQGAEAALALFDQLTSKAEKSGAYRVIGVVYRETGRIALAESRLRSAMQLAVETGSVLNEAEASRELALVYQAMGRNQEALTLLNTAHRLFQQLDARRDLVNVTRKVLQLESAYLGVVREWGESIESSDSYTFGHCERVADTAVAVARSMGLDEQTVTTIRLGAYLHDVGKVRVPHEILNKPGPLTRDELEVVRMHPLWGLELLAGVEFPWDIKPIIRWHHEKHDGTGYPDRLCGDAIPVGAQIVGIVDVFDALTTTRSYRGALPKEEALAEIIRCRGAWSPAVFGAFLGVIGTGTGDRSRTPAGGAPSLAAA